ncbi:MAG: rhomboid family intramembrane serine protease [Myxococcales bacterium]|nr:rhomboid family intramembrane serine protease [Myxococcales bacterium]MCB9733468.1 rhomboid family intramembrane serine protease [Deltaproteobacteria bacterium]
MTRRPARGYGGGGGMGGIGLPRPTPVVLRLMIVIGAIWLVNAFLVNFLDNRALAHLISEWLWVSPDNVTDRYALWTPFTYMWLHASFSHVAFNLLGLYFLGPILEGRWGGRTFLKFFILSGVIGGVFTVLAGLLVPAWFSAPVLGASGSILAIIAAYSILLPQSEILLMFVLPVKGRWLIWISLGIDLAMFLASSPGDGGVAVQTHLGGALGGWLLITGNWRPAVAWGRFRLWTKKKLGGGGKKPPKGGGRGGWRNPNDFRVIRGGRDDDDLLH